MKLYQLKSGHPGILIFPDLQAKEYALKEDQTFDGDDVIIDTSTMYGLIQTGMYEVPDDPRIKVAHDLANEGYTVFGKPGLSNDTNIYMFATFITPENKV